MITKLAILVFTFILIPILNAHAEDSTNVHPGFYEISQYAIGTVGIQIVFVESDGSVDSNNYDWTESEMKQTEDGIKKGLNFWSEQYPFKVGKLEFIFRDSVLGKTGIESSTRTGDGWFHFEDYSKVATETLTDVGCGSINDPRSIQYPSVPSSLKHSGNEFKILVLSCANDVRDDLETDWATVIFVPYTSYQVEGLAFGFMEGAFMQDRYIVTVNGGGIIPAHEWAHMVGVTDMIECDLHGLDDEQCGERSGYLYMEETDTIPMTNCIMGSTGNNPGLPNVCVSDGTKHQMGWVDENNNKIPDLVENDVTVNLSEKQKKDGSSIVIEGTIKLEPMKCKMVKIPRDVITNSKDWNCKDTTINKIIQVTSIPTTEIKPTDGKFDSAFEEFTITLNTAELNNNEIEIKVKDEITGRIHSSTFVLDVEVSETTETAIPAWIKNTAGWWADGQIDDGSFVSGIQWLISNGIMSIPPTEQGAGSDDAIPSWIKNNAGWWADGQIDDNSFVSGLQWLISNGIMKLTQETAEPKSEVKSAFTISSADGYEKYFSKQVNVFGVTILASDNTPDSKVLHVANVLAQYLDNDADGTPDNSKVIYSLKKNKAYFLMCETEDEVECTNWSDDGKWLDDMLIDTGSCSQSQYADETGINNEKFGAFDASLEEVLHLISNCGYGGAYPDVFRSNSVSLIGQYMDNARGGHFEKIPNYYPTNAWYSYDDNSCTYNCMITEYFYWAMTSILGAQEDRFDEIGHEWKLNTKEKVMEIDPDIYNLLTDPQYKLPTILPDGNYQAGPAVKPDGNYQAGSAVKPVDLTISSPPNFEKYFTKYVDVFGVPIYATYSTPDEKVLHAANVLAQYLDNDADGIPDNPLVVEKLKATNSAVPMFLNGWENDNSELWDDFDEGLDLNCWTVLTADETDQWWFDRYKNNPSSTRFDASLEEILHVITQCGYAVAYPEIFGEHKDSLIGKYMDNARGGYFEWVPGKYSADAWYSYDDNSCEYNCMITEYFYWAMTSILGAQENRWNEVYTQWKPNTEEKVMEIDPDIYNLLTDPQYKLPTILPDGNYQG